jgi:acyl carrier protein
MSDGIESQITALIASTLHVDEERVRRQSRIGRDLGADSLDFVSLVLALEDEFQVDIHDEEAAELLTVAQVIEYVTLAIAMKEAPVRGPSERGRTVGLR